MFWTFLGHQTQLYKYNFSVIHYEKVLFIAFKRTLFACNLHQLVNQYTKSNFSSSSIQSNCYSNLILCRLIKSTSNIEQKHQVSPIHNRLSQRLLNHLVLGFKPSNLQGRFLQSVKVLSALSLHYFNHQLDGFLWLGVFDFRLSSSREAGSRTSHHLHIGVFALVFLDLLDHALDVAEAIAFSHFDHFAFDLGLVLDEICIFELSPPELLCTHAGQQKLNVAVCRLIPNKAKRSLLEYESIDMCLVFQKRYLLRGKGRTLDTLVELQQFDSSDSDVDFFHVFLKFKPNSLELLVVARHNSDHQTVAQLLFDQPCQNLLRGFDLAHQFDHLIGQRLLRVAHPAWTLGPDQRLLFSHHELFINQLVAQLNSLPQIKHHGHPQSAFEKGRQSLVNRIGSHLASKGQSYDDLGREEHHRGSLLVLHECEEFSDAHLFDQH